MIDRLAPDVTATEQELAQRSADASREPAPAFARRIDCTQKSMTAPRAGAGRGRGRSAGERPGTDEGRGRTQR